MPKGNKMMNEELITLVNYMEKERGINRETLLQALESALVTASRKGSEDGKDPKVEINRETCEIKVFAEMEVTEKASRTADTISLAKAKKINPDCNIGDAVEVEITPRDFGRIAAQTAKQTILQKIRQAEREIVFEEYKDRAGEIVSGVVRRFERGDILVDLGRAEAIMPSQERVSIEEYQIGDRIRAYIVNVQNNTGGPSVVLSRSHPDFVRRLFELEVTEIADGIVEIKGMAREAGFRTKIAVVSHDEKVDPVGACVGMRGIRVKNIVRELSGEKIDIVRWSDDVKTYVTNALSPAKLLKVYIDPDKLKLVHVVADAEQLSLAIGKRGQNVRLTAKLLGWKVDIEKDEGEVTFEEKVSRAVKQLAVIEGISQENAEALVNAGFLTVEGILAAEQADIEEMAGFDAETAKAICEAASAFIQDEGEELE